MLSFSSLKFIFVLFSKNFSLYCFLLVIRKTQFRKCSIHFHLLTDLNYLKLSKNTDIRTFPCILLPKKYSFLVVVAKKLKKEKEKREIEKAKEKEGRGMRWNEWTIKKRRWVEGKRGGKRGGEKRSNNALKNFERCC